MRLRDTRIRLGITQEDLAAAIEVSRPTIGRIEAGEQLPRRPVARAIYEYFGGVIPLAEIYDPFFDSGKGSWKN